MKLHNLRHQLIRCGEDAACSERVHKSILALMGQMSVQRKRRLKKMKVRLEAFIGFCFGHIFFVFPKARRAS